MFRNFAVIVCLILSLTVWGIRPAVAQDAAIVAAGVCANQNGHTQLCLLNDKFEFQSVPWSGDISFVQYINKDTIVFVKEDVRYTQSFPSGVVAKANRIIIAKITDLDFPEKWTTIGENTTFCQGTAKCMLVFVAGGSIWFQNFEDPYSQTQTSQGVTIARLLYKNVQTLRYDLTPQEISTSDGNVIPYSTFAVHEYNLAVKFNRTLVLFQKNPFSKQVYTSIYTSTTVNHWFGYQRLACLWCVDPTWINGTTAVFIDGYNFAAYTAGENPEYRQFPFKILWITSPAIVGVDGQE